MTIYCPVCGSGAVVHEGFPLDRSVARFRCTSCQAYWRESYEVQRIRYLLPRLYRRRASSAVFHPGKAQDEYMALRSILFHALQRKEPWAVDLAKMEGTK